MTAAPDSIEDAASQLIGRELGEDLCMCTTACLAHPTITALLLSSATDAPASANGNYAAAVATAFVVESVLSTIGLAILLHEGLPLSVASVKPTVPYFAVCIAGCVTFLLLMVAALI